MTNLPRPSSIDGEAPSSGVPVIDLQPWFDGSDADRRRVATAVDAALREIGFLLIINHGVSVELRNQLRAAARRFFTLTPEVKARYRAKIGSASWVARGWLPPNSETIANSDEGVSAPPDLKESFTHACEERTGDAVLDEEWFTDNVWPTEVPEYERVAREYVVKTRALADELLTIAALGLGLSRDYFLSQASKPTWSFIVHWYPSLRQVGEPLPGQRRVGSHTDFGTFTILDRQPGTGGLQVLGKDGRWADAPWVTDSLTVNVGDMMARWTGDRWVSNRHRVLAPAASAPDEDLMSLVYFHEADPGAELRSVPPPVGQVEHAPVTAGHYLRGKLAAIATADAD